MIETNYFVNMMQLQKQIVGCPSKYSKCTDTCWWSFGFNNFKFNPNTI